MTAQRAEVETKLDVDAQAELPRLEALPGVASVVTVEQELAATYFDTADLTLASRGVTVRRRTGGDDAGWHLKLPDNGHRREVSVPLGRATRTVPKQLRGIVLGLTRDQPLVAVAELLTSRSVARLLDDAGAVLAEVADDRVEAAVRALGDHEPASSMWREWEVELLEGDRRLLRAAANLLCGAGATPSEVPSKLARALALADHVPDRGDRLLPRLRKKGPAGDVVATRLAEQVSQMHRLDPLVRVDAPDAVHRMRVALRRIRSALATFRPLLDREVTDAVRDELRWLGRVLGPVRDTEVMHERLGEMLRNQDPRLVRGPVLTRVDRDLTARHREARRRSVEAMESPRYFALLDQLDEIVASPPFGEDAGSPTRETLPRRVGREWKRLRRRVDAAVATSDPTERAACLHEARKAAKRARYAAEPLVTLYGKPARRYVKAVKRVQSVLGEHHDSVVTRQELLRQADQAAADGDNAFTFGVLHAREEAHAAAIEAHFARVWRRASRQKLRRWLS